MKEAVTFDEDEDLFGFADPAGNQSGEEDDIDIAEFLSTIDDNDVSNIAELAESTPASVGGPAAKAPVMSVAQPAVVVATGSVWRQPGMLAFVAIGTLLLVSNLLGTWATWSRNRTVVEEIEGVRLDLRDTVANAKRDIAAETSRLENLTQPRGSSQLGAVSFRTVEEHIAQEDFTTARRLLYSKLAILDRLPSVEREEVESRALFLLAQVDHREALALAREVGS